MSGVDTWTEEGLLRALRQAGASGLERLRFKPNRSTIWSVTGGGTRLNIHQAYRRAPWPVVRHFAVIAAAARLPARLRPREYREAARHVRDWPELELELRRIRSITRRSSRRPSRRRGRRVPRPGPCCATPAQRAELRRLYLELNRDRFQNLLPPDLHLRLSRRMRSRLGQMVGHIRGGRRHVVEIALNSDLMNEGQGGEREDTLLHEMAHAVVWLHRGEMGHGPHWRVWARRVGCVPRASSAIPDWRAEEPQPDPPPGPR